MAASVLIYSTCPDAACARRLGRLLVEEGLAACANILPGMRSVYRWQGRIEEGREAVLLLKTPRRLSRRLIARLAAEHPYEVPCAVALPIDLAHPPFAAWIAASPAPAAVRQRTPQRSRSARLGVPRPGAIR